MNSKDDLRSTFNNVVELYDRYRPSYVDEVFNDIIHYAQIDSSSLTLEVGLGTGKATKPFLETKTKLIGIELGKELAAFALEKFQAYDNFVVKNTSFEDFVIVDGCVDLIYSATAFHWIDEDVGYRKVYRLLKEGGVFARFANRPYKDIENPSIDQDLQKIYQAYMPDYTLRGEFDEEMCKELAVIPLKYGFRDIDYHLYKRTRVLTSDDYIALVATYSHTIAMPEDTRHTFLSEIKAVIDRHGGIIRVFDTIDLQLARK